MLHRTILAATVISQIKIRHERRLGKNETVEPPWNIGIEKQGKWFQKQAEACKLVFIEFPKTVF